MADWAKPDRIAINGAKTEEWEQYNETFQKMGQFSVFDLERLRAEANAPAE